MIITITCTAATPIIHLASLLIEEMFNFEIEQYEQAAEITVVTYYTGKIGDEVDEVFEADKALVHKICSEVYDVYKEIDGFEIEVVFDELEDDESDIILTE